MLTTGPPIPSEIRRNDIERMRQRAIGDGRALAAEAFDRASQIGEGEANQVDQTFIISAWRLGVTENRQMP